MRFRLTKPADLVARTYSGGMQRKLDIAMGLIHRPHVLFLDEPTTGLDPEARADLWNEIERLSSEGLTILLTTHYMDEADRLAERMAIVDRGRVVVEGSPEQLKAELRGDSVQIDFADMESGDLPDESKIRQALERVNGLREITVDGILLHARADQGATAVPLMITALESAGAKVASVKVARPSLDDVYLRYTGRTFEQAEGEKR
jgi:ABC-2 type transport system ATP-binding protein